jgi:hypothetical protein
LRGRREERGRKCVTAWGGCLSPKMVAAIATKLRHKSPFNVCIYIQAKYLNNVEDVTVPRPLPELRLILLAPIAQHSSCIGPSSR